MTAPALIYYVSGGVLRRRGHTPPDPGDGWVAGAVKPNQSGQAGLPAGTSLNVLPTGNVYLTTNGWQYSDSSAVPNQSGNGLTVTNPYKLTNVAVSGRAYCQANKYSAIDKSTVHPVTFYGATSTSDDGSIVCTSSSHPHAYQQCVVSQSDLGPVNATWLTNSGFHGHGYRSIRNKMEHGCDGHGMLAVAGSGNDAYCESIGDWITNNNYFEGSTGNAGGNTEHPDDGNHGDGIQIQGGGKIKIIGTLIDHCFDNTMVGGITKWIRKNNTGLYPTIGTLISANNGHNYYGSLNGTNGIQITQDTGAVTDLVITDNWFNGGYSQFLNFSSKNYAPGQFAGTVVARNQFGRRWGHTAGYYVAGQDHKTVGVISTSITDLGVMQWINTPSGSLLYNEIDFGNGAGQPGTNVYEAVGDALDGTHVGVFRGGQTAIRLA